MSIFKKTKSGSEPEKKKAFHQIEGKVNYPVETPENQIPAIHVEEITLGQVRDALPDSMRLVATQELVDQLNSISADPVHAESIRENFVTFSNILNDGKYRLAEYVNAVQYASYKIMGYSNEEAYARTFPDRIANLRGRGASKKEISSYVSAYHKGQLVHKILDRAVIPFWLLNQEFAQEALMVNVAIMRDEDVSPKVRVEAANSVLTHTQKPKESAFQINIGASETSGMSELKDMMSRLASQQRQMIVDKEMRTIDVAAEPLVARKEDDAN